MRKAWLIALAMTGFCTVAAAQLQVEDTEGRPSRRKIIITSPGVFKAEVWQSSGGGIHGFYDLAVDPEAKVNLAGGARGLFEIGWHGHGFKGPDKEDCCSKHILNKKRFVQDKKTGEMVRDTCYDGCGDWPSTGHKELARKKRDPKILGTLEVIEKSPARVRVRAAKVPFVWWSKYVHKLEATGTYTFYPTGKIVIQVRIQNPGDRPFHWSSEYGPHLMVPGSDKKPEADRGFEWSTPKQEKSKRPTGPSEELVLATSEKVKTSLMLSIPAEAHKLFTRHMRHNGRSIGWDRVGYGSNNLVMPPGYDSTWACMIQMGTPGGKLAPEIRDAKAALPLAIQYREPAKITGVTLVTDDEGDLNKDGYNESEGCHVLKGPGPLSFTYAKGKGAGFAPAFKVAGWVGDAPKTVPVDGKETACVAAAADGKLIVQVMGALPGEKVQVEIGR